MIIGGGGNGPFKIGLPALYGGVIANGTSITVTATAEALVTGGFPPYTYSWTDNMGAVSVQASTSATTRVQATGTNTQHDGVIILIVTQANGVATTASTVATIIQGTP